MLVSRCTDPQNFHLVGVPPQDLIPDLAKALNKHSRLDHETVFGNCVSVSDEWTYEMGVPYGRFQQKYIKERSIPMKHKTLQEALNPQPAANRVLMKLLGWIDRVDIASTEGSSRPAFATETGSNIFPANGDADERWWLTELSKRKADERLLQDLEEWAGSSGDESGEDVDGDFVVDKKEAEETSDSDVEPDDAEDSSALLGCESKTLLPLGAPNFRSRNSWSA